LTHTHTHACTNTCTNTTAITTTTTLYNHLMSPRRPSVVFTCLALFNTLIAPLNAFPWVLGGVVEALVSLQRLQAQLLLPQRAFEWAYPAVLLPAVAVHDAAQGRKRRIAAAAAASAAAAAAAAASTERTTRRNARRQSRIRCLPLPRWMQPQPRQQRAGLVGSSSAHDGGGGGDRDEQQQQLRAPLLLAAPPLPSPLSCKQPAAAVAVALPEQDSGVAVQLCGASFAWAPGQPNCLSQLQLCIPCGCMTAIVGEVGSGKSSLLAALLGELELTGGAALLPHRSAPWVHVGCSPPPATASAVAHRVPGRIAYAAQRPWLVRGSVRDNVLLGHRYDPEVMCEVSGRW
jgi:ABC-type multidrug transport system fused ATPase/permease subunit